MSPGVWINPDPNSAQALALAMNAGERQATARAALISAHAVMTADPRTATDKATRDAALAVCTAVCDAAWAAYTGVCRSLERGDAGQ